MKAQKGYAIAATGPRAKPRSGQHLLARLWKQKRWNEVAAQRRLLASMPDATLMELGLSRADHLEQEVERPFWDDPFNR